MGTFYSNPTGQAEDPNVASDCGAFCAKGRTCTHGCVCFKTGSTAWVVALYYTNPCNAFANASTVVITGMGTTDPLGEVSQGVFPACTLPPPLPAVPSVSVWFDYGPGLGPRHLAVPLASSYPELVEVARSNAPPRARVVGVDLYLMTGGVVNAEGAVYLRGDVGPCAGSPPLPCPGGVFSVYEWRRGTGKTPLSCLLPPQGGASA